MTHEIKPKCWWIKYDAQFISRQKKGCCRFGIRVMKNDCDKTFMYVNSGFLFHSLGCQTNNLSQPLRRSRGATLCGVKQLQFQTGGWQSCDKRRVCKRRFSIIGIFRWWYVCYLLLSAFKWTHRAKEKHWSQRAPRLCLCACQIMMESHCDESVTCRTDAFSILDRLPVSPLICHGEELRWGLWWGRGLEFVSHSDCKGLEIQFWNEPVFRVASSNICTHSPNAKPPFTD